MCGCPKVERQYCARVFVVPLEGCVTEFATGHRRHIVGKGLGEEKLGRHVVSRDRDPAFSTIGARASISPLHGPLLAVGLLGTHFIRAKRAEGLTATPTLYLSRSPNINRSPKRAGAGSTPTCGCWPGSVTSVTPTRSQKYYRRSRSTRQRQKLGEITIESDNCSGFVSRAIENLDVLGLVQPYFAYVDRIIPRAP